MNQLPSLQQAARVADATVRLVALVVVALALVLPLLVILLVALFKESAQDYAYAVLGRVVDLFGVILGRGGAS